MGGLFRVELDVRVRVRQGTWCSAAADDVGEAQPSASSEQDAAPASMGTTGRVKGRSSHRSKLCAASREPSRARGPPVRQATVCPCLHAAEGVRHLLDPAVCETPDP